MESVQAQLLILKDDPFAVDALFEIELAFEDGDNSIESAEWDLAVKRYDHRLNDIVKKNGWYDLLFIQTDGYIVYTASKGSDLGKNISHNELRDSGLAKAYAVAKNMGGGDIAVADFEPYAPAGGGQAAFMVAKMHDQSGDLLGYAAMQMPKEAINGIMQQRTGMGATGESYLVGRLNGKTSFRSDMLTMGDGKYLIGKEISTEYMESALSGKSEQKVFTDSAGNMVMVAYEPVHIKGLNWACISKINLEEAIVPVDAGGTEDYFTKYIDKYGYYDLFLIHPQGRVFYSVAKEADYHTNIVNGNYSDSGLGKLTRQVLSSKQFGLADFAPYAPSNNDPFSFIAQPMINEGPVEIVVAPTLPPEIINAFMKQRKGTSATGERSAN